MNAVTIQVSKENVVTNIKKQDLNGIVSYPFLLNTWEEK